MVPGWVLPLGATAPSTWTKEPPPLDPVLRTGHPVRFRSSMAGALSPGTDLTRPTERISVLRSEDVARLPSPGSRLCEIVTASWSQPWYSAPPASPLVAGSESSSHRCAAQDVAALDGDVESRPRPRSRPSATWPRTPCRWACRWCCAGWWSVQPLPVAAPSPLVQPLLSLTPENRSLLALRYLTAVQTPTYGCGIPSPVLRPCSPASVAASAADRSIWRSMRTSPKSRTMAVTTSSAVMRHRDDDGHGAALVPLPDPAPAQGARHVGATSRL